MKRVKMLMAGIAAALSLTVTAVLPCYAAGSLSIRDDLGKYGTKYPDNFTLKKLGRVNAFISPVVDKELLFSPNVNISVNELPANTSLYDFFSRSKAVLTAEGSKVKILDEKKDKLDKAEAYKIIYTSLQKKTLFKLMQIVAIHNKKAYVITYTALSKQFDKDLANAQTIIRNFVFTD